MYIYLHFIVSRTGTSDANQSFLALQTSMWFVAERFVWVCCECITFYVLFHERKIVSYKLTRIMFYRYFAIIMRVLTLQDALRINVQFVVFFLLNSFGWLHEFQRYIWDLKILKYFQRQNPYMSYRHNRLLVPLESKYQCWNIWNALFLLEISLNSKNIYVQS